MKTKQVKLKLIRVSGITLAAILFAAGIFFGLSQYSTSLRTELDETQTKIQIANSQKEAIKTRVDLSEEAVKFYEGFSRQGGNSDTAFRRDNLISHLVSIKNDLLLNGLQYTLDPFVEKEGVFKKESAVLISSKVTLEFTALSDAVVYKAIESLQDRLPGFVDVVELELIRVSEFQTQNMVDLTAGKIPGLVKCNLTFYWLGVREIKIKETAGGGNANNL